MGPIPGKVQNGWRLLQNGVWTSGPTLLLLAGYPYPGEAQLLTIVVLQEGRATLAYNGHGEIDELWNRPLRMRLITDYLEAIWRRTILCRCMRRYGSATDGSVRTVSADARRALGQRRGRRGLPVLRKRQRFYIPNGLICLFSMF